MKPREAPPADAREARGFRIDLLIAICALFVSTLATGASWWQSRVVQQQLSAQVWPYLSFDTSVGSDALKLAVTNYGTGPALIRDSVLTIDGRAVRDMVTGVKTLIPPASARAAATPRQQRRVSYQITSIQPGSVIRASESRTMVDVAGSTPVVQQLLDALPRVDFRICYCSILEQCWRIDSRERAEQPKAATCDPHDPNALRDDGLGRARRNVPGGTNTPPSR